MKIKHRPYTKFPDVEKIKDELVKEFGQDLGRIILEAFRNIYDDLKSLEKVERVSALPTASLDTRGKFYLLEGGAIADKLYIGIDAGNKTYIFKQITLT